MSASYLVLQDMEESASVSDGVSKDKHSVMETITPPDFSPALDSKLSAVSCAMQHGIQTMRNQMQVLHYVRYFKLYTYV